MVLPQRETITLRALGRNTVNAWPGNAPCCYGNTDCNAHRTPLALRNNDEPISMCSSTSWARRDSYMR